jgi:iron complex outermembrane receptor protein
MTDFAEVMQVAPGTFSVSPNGVGLGQSNTSFRGFIDGDFTITYDGIPFEDTNDLTLDGRLLRFCGSGQVRAAV